MKPPQEAMLVPTTAPLLALALLVWHAAALCPAQCHCNHTALTVSCERGRLEHFPIQLNPRVERLSLAGNRIARLRGSFDYYTRLVSLNLSRNAVSQLAEQTFEHQRRLVELDLGDNLLTELRRRTLAGLRRLTSLSLAGNRLARLENGALDDLAGLRRLDLSRNRLTSLLRQLATVGELRLCNNQLAALPAPDGAPLSGTHTLDLSGNRLTEARGLAALRGLHRLDLSGNRLLTLAAAAPPPSLRQLDISNNRLAALPGDTLAGLPLLEELRLCDSPLLASVAADALAGCPHNRLEGVPQPPAAANLSWLDARGNQLRCNCSLLWLRAAVDGLRVPDVLVQSRSARHQDFSRAGGGAAPDLCHPRSRERRKRSPSSPDIWRPNPQTVGRRTGASQAVSATSVSGQFTEQTKDGIHYIPVTVV
ncbi:reticulon-4 receptor-like 2 [Pollicipes pollicipes]|uniref:reticulon-4 receptor-like 2 n=1 Tax=Pollicipes pollicipes TaxID=41117 RepID=UPI001884F703|nr:reticulon-4 receptor-like 2 [Pollicipes pollicipes]